MRLPSALLVVVTLTWGTSTLADAQLDFDKSNARLRDNYEQVKLSLELKDCRKKHIARVRSNKSLAMSQSLQSSTKDTYINRYMVAFFGPRGELIDPFAQPIESRTILDGGGSFQFTPEIKESSYRVPAGASIEIINTGDRHWMVTAPPLTTVPHFVPESFYTLRELKSGSPEGYSFAYHLITLYDKTNTENKTDDDAAESNCVFYYVSD